MNPLLIVRENFRLNNLFTISECLFINPQNMRKLISRITPFVFHFIPRFNMSLFLY